MMAGSASTFPIKFFGAAGNIASIGKLCDLAEASSATTLAHVTMQPHQAS